MLDMREFESPEAKSAGKKRSSSVKAPLARNERTVNLVCVRFSPSAEAAFPCLLFAAQSQELIFRD